MDKVRKSVKLSTPNGKEWVVFYITPEISESRSVNYVDIGDIRMPASILIWMGSPSRSFNINGKLLARTQQEADVSFQSLNYLKSWCVARVSGLDSKARTGTATDVNNYIQRQPVAPSYPGDINGVTQAAGTNAVALKANAVPTSIALIAPVTPPPNAVPGQTFSVGGQLFDKDTPKVLYLEGYSGQFRKIPVVVTSLNISYPSDVNYIQNSTGVWCPIIQDVAITMKEARELFSSKGNVASGAISGFDLTAFKNGTLDFW